MATSGQLSPEMNPHSTFLEEVRDVASVKQNGDKQLRETPREAGAGRPASRGDEEIRAGQMAWKELIAR